MNHSEHLRSYIKELGANKVGFANVRPYLPDEYKHLKTGISVVIRLSDEIISQIDNKPTHTYFHHYRTVNAFIDQLTLKISMYLQNLGYIAMAVPASQSINTDNKYYEGLFQHKTVATLSGLGWIGKSACFVTEEFGPRVRLGTVLTNIDLEYDIPVTSSKCGKCNICVTKCPALAITGEQWNQSTKREEIYDAKACSDHMHNHYQHIGRGSVCGICISVCPKGNKILKR